MPCQIRAAEGGGWREEMGNFKVPLKAPFLPPSLPAQCSAYLAAIKAVRSAFGFGEHFQFSSVAQGTKKQHR